MSKVTDIIVCCVMVVFLFSVFLYVKDIISSMIYIIICLTLTIITILCIIFRNKTFAKKGVGEK